MTLVTPVGYSGPVTNEEWAKFAGHMGTPYAVLPLLPSGTDPSGSFRPTKSTTVARSVRIAAGRAFGAGVIDTNNATVEFQLPTVSSGYRWYLVAIRRTWGSTKASSFVAIQSGTNANLPTIPARSIGAGVEDDQPICLALLKAGETEVQNIIDLRVFFGAGGLYAIDPTVTQYLPVGTVFRCGNTVYSRVLSSNLTPTWTTQVDPVPPETGWLHEYTPEVVSSAIRSSYFRHYGVNIPPQPFPRSIRFDAYLNLDFQEGNGWRVEIEWAEQGSKNEPGSGSVLASQTLEAPADQGLRQPMYISARATISANDTRVVRVWVRRWKGNDGIASYDLPGFAFTAEWNQISSSSNKW